VVYPEKSVLDPYPRLSGGGGPWKSLKSGTRRKALWDQ